MTDDLIHLDGVSKAFGRGARRVRPLRGVTLSVRRGESLVVLGPSGTGKSVMLRLIVGLLDPDGGRVFFEGRDLATMSQEELDAMRRRMAMLFQGGALFDSMTVGENVAFVLRLRGEKDDGIILERVRAYLGQVGLPGTEDKMPSELSGGMRKRAALARSIAGGPEVILYDEPTTGLDPIMSDAIADLVRDTHAALAGQNVTSVIVTHDIKVALKTGDRLIMLYNGRVVGEGPPEMFRRLLETDLAADAPEGERMIQQFVRGEAHGPIQAVVLPGVENETRTVVRPK